VSAVKTFRNGCNYRLVKDADDEHYLEYGCYGVHVTLVTGDEKLLYKWFCDVEPLVRRRLDGVVLPETIFHLYTMKPCIVCGGARFRKT